MAIAIVTQDGSVRLPEDILESLHLRVGDKVDLHIDKDGAVRMRPKTRTPSEVAGMLANRTHVKSTIEEMDEAVAEGFRTGLL